MKRKELIKRLENISFNILWPDDSWEDLGFTESPIWINGNGYGYFACDEPNIFYKAERIPDEKWQNIRKKIESEKITLDDIQGTSLSKMYFCEDEEHFSCKRIHNLLNLPEVMGEYYYCGETSDQIMFFDTEKEFLEYFERDDVLVQWEELSNEALCVWIERLSSGKYDQGFSFYEEV